MTRKQACDIVLETVITCPSCKKLEKLSMQNGFPGNVFVCQHCYETHQTKPDECCIYCSFGSLNCPPLQEIVYQLANK